jgi:hypothetical protein
MVIPTRGEVPTASAHNVVASLLARARVAQRAYEKYTQKQVDDVVAACGWAIMEPSRNRLLAGLALIQATAFKSFAGIGSGLSDPR